MEPSPYVLARSLDGGDRPTTLVDGAHRLIEITRFIEFRILLWRANGNPRLRFATPIHSKEKTVIVRNGSMRAFVQALALGAAIWAWPMATDQHSPSVVVVSTSRAQNMKPDAGCRACAHLPATREFTTDYDLEDECLTDGLVAAAACLVHRQVMWSMAGNRLYENSSIVAPFERGTLATSLRYIAEYFRSSPDLRRQYRTAVAFYAMDYVQAHVSTALWGFDTTQPNFFAPKTAEDALRRGIGICGTHIAVFEAILGMLNVPVRHVQLWYTDVDGQRASHIVAEVEWDSRWHLFDVTWGAHYPSLDSTLSNSNPLSIVDVLKLRPRPVWNPNNPAMRSVLASGIDPFAYLDGHDFSLTVADVGEVIVRPALLPSGIRLESFQDVPNFVGFNRPETRMNGGTSFLFQGLSGSFDVTVNVTGHAGCDSGHLELDGVQAEPKDGAILFRGMTDPKRLSVSSLDDVCYLVMKSVEISPVVN